MVSVHPNPPSGQGFPHLYGYNFGGLIGNPVMKMTEESSDAIVEDPSKKIRKSYTITKSRENWSEQEHDKFVEALHIDRDFSTTDLFLKFIAPLRSRDRFVVKMRVSNTSATRVFLQHFIFKIPNLEPIVEARATTVWLDKNYRPVRIPLDVQSTLI